jgi:hypothetical protein
VARDVNDGLARDGWRAVPLTLVAVVLICLLQAVQQTGPGNALVGRGGGVEAALPWWSALARTPLSLFVPAADLPVWGALAQVLAVFGPAEITLGRARTLAVAYLATLSGTVCARWAVAHGMLGLSPADAFTRDTGPSSAVVALAVCVAWRYRAWWTALAVVLAMAGEVVFRPNLAGWEHLVAIGVAVVACLARETAGALPRPPRTPAGRTGVAPERRTGARTGPGGPGGR